MEGGGREGGLEGGRQMIKGGLATGMLRISGRDSYCEVLEEPRPEDVGGYFGEDAAFLLVLFAVGVIVVLTGTVAATDAGVTRVTC